MREVTPARTDGRPRPRPTWAPAPGPDPLEILHEEVKRMKAMLQGMESRIEDLEYATRERDPMED